MSANIFLIMAVLPVELNPKSPDLMFTGRLMFRLWFYCLW